MPSRQPFVGSRRRTCRLAIFSSVVGAEAAHMPEPPAGGGVHHRARPGAIGNYMKIPPKQVRDSVARELSDSFIRGGGRWRRRRCEGLSNDRR